MAALLVLGLVFTSLPARVWLFGACPICGQFHEKILLICLGGDPAPANNPGDESPDEDRAADGCFPPLPYCSTESIEPPTPGLASGAELRPQSDAQLVSLPPSALIRPPRA
jgi:hypothetical protein